MKNAVLSLVIVLVAGISCMASAIDRTEEAETGRPTPFRLHRFPGPRLVLLHRTARGGGAGAPDDRGQLL